MTEKIINLISPVAPTYVTIPLPIRGNLPVSFSIRDLSPPNTDFLF